MVSKTENQVAPLQRVIASIGSTWIAQVETIREADDFLSQARPEVIILDTDGMSTTEYLGRLEPFVLTLPRGIKVFLVNPDATSDDVLRASEIGVDGILKSISSHYSISTMLQKIRKGQQIEQSAAA